LELALHGVQVLRVFRCILVALCTLNIQCSWWKDYVAKNDFDQVCIKANAFLWDDYRTKPHIEAKNDFENYLFKDLDSKLVQRVWNESFEQPLSLRYSYFSSQLKSFGADAAYCLILEKLFEDQIPDQAFPMEKMKK
jgi:hypothetical protein